jgi:hypothetical protein
VTDSDGTLQEVRTDLQNRFSHIQRREKKQQQEERRGYESLQRCVAHRVFSRMHEVSPAYSISTDMSSGGRSQQPMEATAAEYKPEGLTAVFHVCVIAVRAELWFCPKMVAFLTKPRQTD